MPLKKHESGAGVEWLSFFPYTTPSCGGIWEVQVGSQGGEQNCQILWLSKSPAGGL